MQLAVGTWVMALVTMQLDLPHPAVMEVRGGGGAFWEGLVCRPVQCGADQFDPSKRMQGPLCRLWQAGIAVLGVSMLALLRTRFVGKSSLPVTLQQQAAKHS